MDIEIDLEQHIMTSLNKQVRIQNIGHYGVKPYVNAFRSNQIKFFKIVLEDGLTTNETNGSGFIYRPINAFILNPP